MHKIFIVVAISFLAAAHTFCLAQSFPDIQVNGLFKGTAVMTIDGQQRMLKVGKTTPEGITLVSANSKQAVIEYQGKKQTLELSRRVGGKFKEAEKTVVRIPRGGGDHFYANGKINGHTTQFVVDTGATTVTMNAATAKRLSLRYKKGTPVKVNTANGQAEGFRLTLDRVAVGTLLVRNVDAIVLTGSSPSEVLLGNSYLSRVEMKIENELLVLSSKL